MSVEAQVSHMTNRNNNNDGDDNQRRLPVFDETKLSNEFRNGQNPPGGTAAHAKPRHRS
jgi:hypothetical protein